MASLYELGTAYENLMDNMEEISEEKALILKEEMEKAIIEKSSNIIGYYQNKKTFIDSVDTEIKRLQELKKVESNKLDRYKDYLKTTMESLGYEKIETPVGKLTICKSPISVDIINEDLVPEEYKEEVKTIKIDKKAIADNFKETGELIDGVKINYSNTSLRIK